MDNLVNSLVSRSIGLTDQQVKDNLLAKPNMNDSQMVQFMRTNGVSPSQMSTVVGIPEGQIAARVAATVPQGSSVTLGDTVIVPQYRTTGSGMDEQIGALESFATSKSNGDANYKAPVGTPMQIYSADGQFVDTVKTKKDQSFFGGLKDALTDPVVLAAIGGAYAGGLFGGAGAAGTTFAGEALADASLLSGGGGTTLGSLASTGAPFGGEALADASLLSGGTGANTALSTLGVPKTAAELAQLDLATGGAGGTLGAETFANATATNANVPTLTNLTGGSGVYTGAAGGITADSVAQKLAADSAANPLAKAAGAKTIIDPTTGLATSALANLAGSVANQSGISNARDLINEYGTQAKTTLADAYKNAQNINTANRTDLGNIYSNTNTNLNNTINAQAGVYRDTGDVLADNYAKATGDLRSVYDQQVGFQQPYQDIGKAGSKAMLEQMPYLTKQFGTADLYSGLAPNYDFQLAQGQMANQRAGNTAGGALGGNALTGLQRYTQDYAGGAYQNAFNNFQNQRNNIYGTLSGMANIGLNSAGQLVSLGNTYGSNLSSLSANYGSNRVANAGQMQGAYNQYGSNLTNAANTYGGNLTSNAATGVGAANVYGTNAANLATGVGSALAGNATATGANTATALSNMGNAALLGSVIRPV